MEQVIKSILLLSVAGTVLTALLLLLKPLTRRMFGSRWQYYIWLVVLVVMVLPVRMYLPQQQLGKTQDHLPAPTILSEKNAGQPAVPQAVPPAALTDEKAAKEGSKNGPQAAVTPAMRPVLWRIAAFLWLVGALVFFSGGLLSYIRFMRKIHKNAADLPCPMLEQVKKELGIHREITVKTTNLLATPLLTGVRKPVLLLSSVTLEDDGLRFVLLHELTHLKRRDLWYKWFAFLVNAVHWFNPFVYLAVRQIGTECEISCDLAVTKDREEEEKKGYMNTIIRLASMKKEGE